MSRGMEGKRRRRRAQATVGIRALIETVSSIGCELSLSWGLAWWSNESQAMQVQGGAHTWHLPFPFGVGFIISAWSGWYA